MTISVEHIVELKQRLQTIHIERAKLEERRKTAHEAVERARKKLTELGFDPDNAKQELEATYDSIDDQLSALEEELGIA